MEGEWADSVCRYFVDEAGDGVLFDRKGRVLVGTPGCSRFFILGLLECADPEAFGCRFDELRISLLSDSYFRGVPSLKPDGRKTAVFFHAKDDLPEVRREVFRVLREQVGLRFFAIVRDKTCLAQYEKERRSNDPNYRYDQVSLYDALVRRLFRDRLHKSDEYEITFAKRWRSDRTTALETALEVARKQFTRRWGITSHAPIKAISAVPSMSAGLQAVDYYLWALQRLCERGEDRYLEYLWDSCHLIVDMDDDTKAGYGVYYTRKRPLTAAAFSQRRSGPRI